MFQTAPGVTIPFPDKIQEEFKVYDRWNTFSQETPGECRLVSINGFDVYDVAEQLKKQGLYRAKIIES